MPALEKRLITPALAALLALVGCDEAAEQTAEAPEVEVALPANYYTTPPAPAEPPPPPVPGRLAVPESFDMGRAQAGADFVTRRIPIGVTGETPVILYGIERSGSEELAFSTDCPDQLQPGETCLLQIEYAPQDEGPLSASLLLATNRALTTIAVTGMAFRPEEPPAPPPPEPEPPRAEPPPPPSPYASPAYRLSQAVLQARRARGPMISSLQDGTLAVVPPEYLMTDEDYLRENTPSAETSFPVDRTNILTFTRMQWGVLDREIQSSLPGLVIVRIDQDVYGTDGLVKILEKGDAFVGRYEPLEKVGDDRLNICFFRIIRLADGAHVYNDDECFGYATDAMGRVGLVGEVDNRMWEKYGSAFVTASISALASFGTSQFDDGNANIENSSEALSDQLGKITASMIEENIDLAPIITVAGGERVGIQLLRDLYIRRPEPLEE